MSKSTIKAAIRIRARLQPIGGQGTFVQPPTYVDGRGNVLVAHHQRRIGGQDVHCTLVGSVACMANQFEKSLEALRAEGLPLSVAVVHADVGGYPLHESTLTMPHRGADAIARSCVVGGVPYMQSEPGQALLCNTSDVRRLARWHQTMLLLGGWFSARSHGGVKIPRCLQSELVAIHSVPCSTVGGRFDSTPASSAVKIYRQTGDGLPFSMDGSGKANKPSELPLGMIPSGIEERGVTADVYDMTATLSLAAVRSLRCGDVDPTPLHNALEQLGIAVLLRTLSDGIYLRSRCHLVPESIPIIEAIGADGSVSEITTDATQAAESAKKAIADCVAAGIPWGSETVELQPSQPLIDLITKSLAVGVGE